MSEEVKETAGGELTQGEFKIKKSPKKLVNQDPIAKVDLSQPKKVIEETITKVDLTKKEEKEPVEEEQTPIIQEIKEEEIKEEVKEVTKELKEAVRDEKVAGRQLPDNVEKLVSFMEETGGDVEDYVRLNTDYSKVDDNSLLREYYKNTKPHLDHEEISFIMEDNFKIDEDLDEERDIKKKKLAFKEEIAKAKNFLEETKSKYYDEIKLRPGVTQEQQKAMDFFNRYNSEQDKVNKTREDFIDRSNQFFNEDFKGFDFKLKDKNVKYQVSNPNELAKNQNDIANFLKKFLNEDGAITDLSNYHKSLFAAQNIDTIASHFYEQGKADAVKTEFAKSKNINSEPRLSPDPDAVFLGGMKIKAVSGVNSAKLKIRKK